MYDFVISDSSFTNFSNASCQTDYSLLKLFTGLAIAALIAWKLTLINAMMMDPIPAIKNKPQLNSILYAKFSSHLCIKYHASGVAIAKAIMIRNTNSFENKYTMFDAVAPNTFLIPTSLILCTAINDANPYNPRQLRNIAMPAKILYKYSN